MTGISHDDNGTRTTIVEGQPRLEPRRGRLGKVGPPIRGADGHLNLRLVGDARIRSGHVVLDLGSGTGYRLILAGASRHRRAERISFPIAVRVVVGRKPS